MSDESVWLAFSWRFCDYSAFCLMWSSVSRVRSRCLCGVLNKHCKAMSAYAGCLWNTLTVPQCMPVCSFVISSWPADRNARWIGCFERSPDRLPGGSPRFAFLAEFSAGFNRTCSSNGCWRRPSQFDFGKKCFVAEFLCSTQRTEFSVHIAMQLLRTAPAVARVLQFELAHLLQVCHSKSFH